MPKERFHLFLADKLSSRCKEGSATAFPSVHAPLRVPASPPGHFFVGAISPDIFFYDLPSFSLSSLGDALHALLDRKGISVIFDWTAQSPYQTQTALSGSTLWALGLACHFIADAIWHPIIQKLSRSHLDLVYSGGKDLSEIECHRLIESELESSKLAGSSGKYDALLQEFRRHRRFYAESASFYRGFLDFAGLGAGVSQKQIVRCFLWQNFSLRFFAWRILGRHRDHLLTWRATRALGALVARGQTFLPLLFSRTFSEDKDPFSDRFLERALAALEQRFCGTAGGPAGFSG
jgi:hypothetical protein